MDILESAPGGVLLPGAFSYHAPPDAGKPAAEAVCADSGSR